MSGGPWSVSPQSAKNPVAVGGIGFEHLRFFRLSAKTNFSLGLFGIILDTTIKLSSGIGLGWVISLGMNVGGVMVKGLCKVEVEDKDVDASTEPLPPSWAVATIGSGAAGVGSWLLLPPPWFCSNCCTSPSRRTENEVIPWAASRQFVQSDNDQLGHSISRADPKLHWWLVVDQNLDFPSEITVNDSTSNFYTSHRQTGSSGDPSIGSMRKFNRNPCPHQNVLSWWDLYSSTVVRSNPADPSVPLPGTDASSCISFTFRLGSSRLIHLFKVSIPNLDTMSTKTRMTIPNLDTMSTKTRMTATATIKKIQPVLSSLVAIGSISAPSADAMTMDVETTRRARASWSLFLWSPPSLIRLTAGTSFFSVVILRAWMKCRSSTPWSCFVIPSATSSFPDWCSKVVSPLSTASLRPWARILKCLRTPTSSRTWHNADPSCRVRVHPSFQRSWLQHADHRLNTAKCCEALQHWHQLRLCCWKCHKALSAGDPKHWGSCIETHHATNALQTRWSITGVCVDLNQIFMAGSSLAATFTEVSFRQPAVLESQLHRSLEVCSDLSANLHHSFWPLSRVHAHQAHRKADVWPSSACKPKQFARLTLG